MKKFLIVLTVITVAALTRAFWLEYKYQNRAPFETLIPVQQIDEVREIIKE